MRTLITTLMLLTITSQAHALSMFDSDGRLIGVTGLTLSDGMTYEATVQYNIPINDATPSSGLADALLDEAGALIAAGNDPFALLPSVVTYNVFFATEVDSVLDSKRQLEGFLRTQKVVDDEDFEYVDFDSFGSTDSSVYGLIQFQKTQTFDVPEPLTATLIPLAVAPLLLRRRREA